MTRNYKGSNEWLTDISTVCKNCKFIWHHGVCCIIFQLKNLNWNGRMILDCAYGVQDPIVDSQYLSENLNRPRLQWPKDKQLVRSWQELLLILVLYIDLRPGQTCHSKVMHRKIVTHSDGSYPKKSRRRAFANNMGQNKNPWYTHRLMHQKRVTCEQHDSHFHLMTIKHAIPKIEWAIELLYNSVRTGSQWVGYQMSWRQDVVEKDSRKLSPRASSWASGERERHNADGHKSGGQYIAVLFGLQLPLTHKPFK